jgi:hypothetical protein
MAGTSKTDKPKQLFTFSSGHQIVLCGYQNKDKDATTYSEFILQECGQNTVIDFWEALFTGTIEFKNDIIYINELVNLPTGPNRSFIQTQWSTETIQYNNNKLVRKFTINKNIRKYTNAEIAQTLNEFNAGSANYNGNTEEVMYRLFVAAISGNTDAEKYFNEFNTKFTTIDGGVLEEYKDLSSMLIHWKKN